MKPKKVFSFTDKNQIWRLLISNEDQLIIETRNVKDKEVFFHCYDLINGKKVFTKLQLNEKFWMGIEALKNGIIYFHNFAKPNMPEHKGIIAYSIIEKKIIWQNNDLTFLALIEDKIYAIKKKFEGQDVFILNSQNGNIEKELGNDPKLLSQIINQSQLDADFSDYLYPEQNQLYTKEIKNIINKEIGDKGNIENIESLYINSLLYFNYYKRQENNLLDNVFVVYNLEKRKKVIYEVINKNLNAFAPDSFFVYKNYLLVLKNKNEIVSYKIH